MSSRSIVAGAIDVEEDEQGVVVDDYEDVQIPTFDKEPYYFEADDTKFGYKNKHNIKAYLDADARPTLAALVKTCTKERDTGNVLFEQGMWVEYRSNDMKWKVGVVNRVIKQPPDDWDFDVEQSDPPEERMEISYNVGVEGVVSVDNIRAPELGLKLIFGKRPWLWQQFTLLQLEKRVRFDEGHEYDFEQIDNLKFASVRFDEWLLAEENKDFKELYDSQKNITQQLLKSHLFVPFDLMDFITERKDEWNFDDPDISIYTYLAVLGSGVGMAAAAFTIQAITPLLLLYNNMVQSDGGPSPRFFVDDDSNPENGDFLPSTDFDKFCKADGRPEGKALIAMVLLIYISSVVPDSILSFYRTSGGAKSTYSKINSLRNIIWEQNDDDIQQQIGFKLDRIMNTGYLALLYSIMLFILLNTPIVLDIILNALAIDYIHQIDEKLADADWWDEDNRWIRAGTIELVIQAVLRLRVLESGYRICAEYDIDEKQYKAAVGKMAGLCDKTLAAKDDKDFRFMTKKERKFAEVAEAARKSKDKFVLNEYEKGVVQFGLNGQIAVLFGLRNKGLFHRYPNFRVWSRWEKVLFLPRLPGEDVKELMHDKRAANVILGKTDFREFLTHIYWVLSGAELLTTTYTAMKHRYFLQVPVRIFIGFFEILFYLFLILFPFAVAFCIIFIPICY